MPEVSLITSWHAGQPGDSSALPGLQYALRAGVRLLDLYFLNPLELPWYLSCLSSLEGRWTQQEMRCPLKFAAGLQPEEIHILAEALTQELTGPHYTGRLIGPRPRFVALATYWPLIADNSEDKRALSVKAVQNSILLAEELGCEHVEVVGGAAFSGTDGRGADTVEKRVELAEELRIKRMARLALSLAEVFDGDLGKELLSRGGRCPKLCVEMEPGSAFLIRDIRTFHQLHKSLVKSIRPRVMLNVDLAHMFLADVEAHTNQQPQGQEQLDYLREHPEVKSLIGHFHCSDHARSHASDLCPGTYHFWQRDYKPWLELVLDRVERPGFSNAIAVEMEAVTDIHEVMRAVGRTRAWLKSLVGSDDHGHQAVTGVVMAVDIANSTKVLAREGLGVQKGASRLDLGVSAICRVIQKHRGSVYSFTGDGVVAVFDEKHFLNDEECARAAIAAGDALYETMRTALLAAGHFKRREAERLAVRVAMHWGEVRIPSHGPLKHQVLGANVIIACRMLALVDGVLTEPPEELAAMTHQVAISLGIKNRLPEKDSIGWEELSPEALDDSKRFRGLNWALIDDEVDKVYLKNGLTVR